MKSYRYGDMYGDTVNCKVSCKFDIVDKAGTRCSPGPKKGRSLKWMKLGYILLLHIFNGTAYHTPSDATENRINHHSLRIDERNVRAKQAYC